MGGIIEIKYSFKYIFIVKIAYRSPQFDEGFNGFLSDYVIGKNIYTFWWRHIGQVLTIYKEDIREKWRLASHDIIVERRMNDRF